MTALLAQLAEHALLAAAREAEPANRLALRRDVLETCRRLPDIVMCALAYRGTFNDVHPY